MECARVNRRWKRCCRRWLLSGMTAMLLSCAVLPQQISAATEPTYELTEDTQGITAFVGQVNVDELNVRTGFGANYPIATVNGVQLVLKEGDRVAVMSSGNASNGNVWYEVRWVENGVEYHGYVNARYVRNTEQSAVPLPTPTPEATPTPEPTPTPQPTKAPQATPTPQPTIAPAKEGDGGGMMLSIARAIGILAIILVIAALIYLFIMKRRRESLVAETSEKIDNLKKLQFDKGPEDVSGNPISVMRRKQPELAEEEEERPVKQRRGVSESEASILARKERAKIVNEEIIEETRFYNPYAEQEESDRMRKLSESLKEKEFIKEEIDNLKPGDLVYHEYFGKGVVFDNSDVKVIEIRFGADVRFINKVSCVAKKLMRKI